MAYPRRIYAKRHSAGLLISAVFLLCYTGGNGLVVKTSVGDDVVLPCKVEPTTDATDVHWSTGSPSDDYVHFRRDGKDDMTRQTPSYKGRTSLFSDESKKGNMSLKLFKVTPSDEGNYTCTVPEINEFIIQLIVETPQVPDNRSLDGHGDTISLEVSPAASLTRRDGVIIKVTILVVIIIIIMIIMKRRCLLEFAKGLWPKSSANHRYPNLMNGGSSLKNGVSAEVKLQIVEAETSTPLTSQEEV